MKTFDAIIGHEHQLKMLANAIEHGRVAHAYLFDGPEGIGKKLVAQAFSRAFLCETANGCGCCAPCLQINAGTHPDYYQLQPDGDSIKIDQIRLLQPQLALKSFAGRGKVCVIDDADLMTREAANALLKTLEEPPANTLLVLVTSRIESLLATIRSRCQRVRFNRLPRQDIARHLEQHLAINPAEAAVLAAVADGSLAKALGQQQDLYLKRRHHLIQSLSALASGSSIQLFEFAQSLKEEKDHINEILDLFELFFRDLLLHQHGQSDQHLINQDILPLIHQQGRELSRPQLLAKLHAVAQARLLIGRNVNLHLAMDHMVMQIAHA